ncbi:hypothetical protein ARMGADRAFT_1037838 [Armillaria gallica]|uniref:Uncharacterized protein n=1 Tax=Armillaria gallica TaxID=47427 RepID=A0A2H3CNM4_ARMGA|nr:hypothetical protein ARMGADRAFT_1037838 [Armillaria gallica]
MFHQTDATATEHLHKGWIPVPKRRAIWCLYCPILHVVPTENTAFEYTASVSKILLVYDASPLEDVSEALLDVRSRIRCSLKGSRTDLEKSGPSFHGGLMLAHVVWGEIVRFESGMMILSEEDELTGAAVTGMALHQIYGALEKMELEIGDSKPIDVHCNAQTIIDHLVVPIKYHGWIYGCAPTSPAWRDTIGFTSNVPPPLNPPKTFIFDHRKAMDPRLHPHLLRESTNSSSPREKTPFFLVARSLLSLTPKPYCITTSPSRTRSACWVEREPVGKGELVRKARYGLEMIDTAFLEDPDVCENPKRMYEFAEAVTAGAGEVDGNAWSGRFKWLLSSRAPIFNPTIYPE